MGTLGLARPSSRNEASHFDFLHSCCCCQCSSYTYRQNGIVHGNCKSQREGLEWCFVHPYYNNCEDNVPYHSGPFKGRSWSWQACGTPALSSSECAGKC